jgi:hypothetical protein
MSGHRIHTPSDNVKIVPVLDPESRTADANGGYVDTLGFTSILWLFHLGTHDRTTGDETVEFQVQQADDTGGTNLEDISGATSGVIGDFVPDAGTGEVYAIEVQLDMAGRRRYQRPQIDVSGTTPIVLTAVTAILFSGDNPPTQPSSVTVVQV